MKFDILDPNVGIEMNVFLIIGNVICIGYNIPQMIQTYKTRSTKDINEWFILLRVLGNTPFVVYSIYLGQLNLIISYSFAILASLFIGYFKFLEISSKHEPIENDDEELKDMV